jgi:hypothetical protein
VPSRVGRLPAQALLDQIVSSDPAPSGSRRPAHRVPAATRLILAAAMTAVCAAVVSVTLPATMTGGESVAWASWTPTPSPLSATDATAVVDACLADTSYTPAEARAGQVVGEQRGDYAYLSVVTSAWTLSCFRDQDGRVRHVSEMVEPVSAAALGGHGVELTGWSQFRAGEGSVRLMAGRLGADVTAVEITVRGTGTRTVHATVRDGMFLAWYPEADASINRTLVTLHLRDGSTVDDLAAGDLHDAPALGD